MLKQPNIYCNICKIKYLIKNYNRHIESDKHTNNNYNNYIYHRNTDAHHPGNPILEISL